ncbi:MAG TPA: Tm-1-like ATP-binding domain-containing protein, partial [Chloroflexota bacterium]|nr:Tm-1-like ATP-binding domain-containing protein [Chloroflexota bacterium]
RVVIPAGGFSAYDGPGEAFYDPAADRAFIAGLQGALDWRVAVAVRPEHINDDAFAEALVAALADLLAGTAPAVAGVPRASEEGKEVS